MTIQQYKNQLITQLSSNYQENEAESITWILLSGILKFSKIKLLSQFNQPITNQQIQALNKAGQRILSGEPVQYVLGKAPFLNLELTVNKNVLIPRQETEELVMWIYSDWKNYSTPKIIDIGTGSGCIALALKQQMCNAHILATDVSVKALQTAKLNADNNNLSVSFHHNNILDESTQIQDEFDVIVSNPPYITNKEEHLMPSNVLEYEPHLALFSNTDALAFYKAIGNYAFKNLKRTGALYFELNEFNLEATMNCLQRIGFTQLAPKKDLNNKWRMLKVKF